MANAQGPPADPPPSERVARSRSRAAGFAFILIFDVVGPLVAYYSLRSAGLSTVAALLLSGVLPAVGVSIGAVRDRRLDPIGGLVLLGLIVRTVVGLATRSTHLILLDGTVPTAVFGAVCIASLWSARPLIYRFALETMGPGTAKGLDFADHWRYPGFRHAFRVTTVVWGCAYLAEAAAHAVIVETTSTGTAKVTSTLLPFAVLALLVAWNVPYARSGQRKGELAAEAARARGDAVPAMPR